MTAADQPLRLAEVTGVLSLATDLSMGQRLEHGLRTAVLAVRLARAMGSQQLPLAVRLMQVAQDADLAYLASLAREQGAAGDQGGNPWPPPGVQGGGQACPRGSDSPDGVGGQQPS